MHFGYIGFGSILAAGNDTFGAAILDAIAEPDLIIKTGTKQNILAIDVEDVIVWDNRQWHAKTNNQPDFVGGEAKIQNAQGGIVKDNTVNGNDAPTADTIAEGTQPGGSGGAATGTAGGGPG